MTRSKSPPPYLRLVVEALQVGMTQGVEAAIAKGVPSDQALAQLRSNVVAFGAHLASPEVNFSPVTVSSMSIREALFQEIKETACVYVVSKWPGAPAEYNIIERHTGKQASTAILEFTSSVGFTSHYTFKLFPNTPVAPDKVTSLRMKTLEGLVAFGYNCVATGRDSIGRQYLHTVVMILSPQTAEKLSDFILREDPNFVLDLYKALLPQNAEKNKIELSPRLLFVKDNKSFTVPDFTPDTC